MLANEKLLILSNSNFQTKVDSIFGMIQNNPGALQLAMANPVGTFAKGLLDLDFDLQRVSDSNRLMFSLLANDLFRNWAVSYQQTIIAQARVSQNYILDRAAISQDVAQAMVNFADKNLLYSLQSFNDPNTGNTVNQPACESSADNGLWVAVSVVVLVLVGVAIVLIPIVLLGIAKDPVTGPFFPGTMTPAQLQALADQIVLQSKTLSTQGKLTDANRVFV